MRLGAELAGNARFRGRVGGIFHTDEMPAYGVTENELAKLGELLKKGPQDAVVFVADIPENVVDALKAVVERAKVALKGVPEETRAANPDGSTKFMRPRPGAARMYPETDVPPIQVTKGYVEELNQNLPEMPEQLSKRLIADYNLNKKLVKQLLDSEYLEIFENLAKETQVSPTTLAVTLTETLKALKRDGVEVETISDNQFRDLFVLLDQGKTAKESIPELLTHLAKNPDETVEEALEKLGLSMLSQTQLENLIDKVIEKNRGLIESRGKGAYGALMGTIMKDARGRAEAQLVNDVLKKKLEKLSK